MFYQRAEIEIFERVLRQNRGSLDPNTDDKILWILEQPVDQDAQGPHGLLHENRGSFTETAQLSASGQGTHLLKQRLLLAERLQEAKNLKSTQNTLKTFPKENILGRIVDPDKVVWKTYQNVSKDLLNEIKIARNNKAIENQCIWEEKAENSQNQPFKR